MKRKFQIKSDTLEASESSPSNGPGTLLWRRVIPPANEPTRRSRSRCKRKALRSTVHSATFRADTGSGSDGGGY